MLHHSYPSTPILRYTSLIPTLHYVTSFRTEIGLVEMCQLGHQKHVGHPQECGSSAFFVCDRQYKPSKFASNKTMQTKTCSAIVVALLFLSLLSIFMGNLNLCFGPHPPRAAVESQLNAMKGALWGSCGTVQLELLAAVLCAAFTTARRWWVHSEIWDLNESLYHSHPARLYPPKQGGKSAGSKWSLALFHLLDYEAPVVAGLGR